MNISTLKIYCDVISLKSFSRAARENGVSQSAVSQAVFQLERSLGVQLLDRSTRPFEVTEEGLIYYQGARELVERYTSLENEVRSLGGDLSGTVRVAAIYSSGLSLISSAVQHFNRLYPKCNVRLAFLHPHRVYENVAAGEAELGIVSYPEETPDISFVPWRDEEMILVCPFGHSLAKEPRLSTLRRIAPERFVAFDPELVIRREVDNYLSRHGVTPDVVMSFDNAETIKRAVELGEGVAILPETVVSREIDMGALAAVRLPRPGLLRPLGIIFRRSHGLFRSAQRFRELLQEMGKLPQGRRAA